jgi:imidazolonepropionase-like amidohydrolase
MHRYMEYGSLRDAELVRLPLNGGPVQELAKGQMGGVPHFSAADPRSIYLLFDDGLNAVPLDGSGRRLFIQVTGPGYYFLPGRANVDDLRLSPDGQWVLAQVNQQLHLIRMPAELGKTIDIADTRIEQRRLTSVGADFLQWSHDGHEIAWAIGSTWYRSPLSRPGQVQSFNAVVEVPRATPRGALLLRGATVLTMRAGQSIPNADLLIVNDRISAIGSRGSLRAPKDVIERDVTGKWIVPGFIDDHDHLADVRRVVLDLESWGPAANLAYGVTTAFDPSTLSIDLLAYQDLIDAGLMTGSRIRSTGPALFSFNEFKSKAEVDAVLDRYAKHYRLSNIKLYRTGNRQVRQWIAQSALEHHLMVTTEGAGSTKLDLTQIQDGMAGAEHALPAAPLYRDVIELMARSGVGYNTTLMVASEAPAQDYFIVEKHPNADPKLNRFAPRFIVDMKTRKRTWRELADYPFPAYAESAARLARAGGLVGMGSHGEVPGLAFHWEMEGHVMGGMTPSETLYAATMGSARAIGRESELGSIEPGKIADLIILERDPLADIRNTLAITEVMQGGRLYSGDTLDQIWPSAKPFPEMWYRSDKPPGTPDPATPR